MNVRKIAGPLILILSIIILCAILTRVFSGSETLAEYATRNPAPASQEQEEAGQPKEALQSEANTGEKMQQPEAEEPENSSNGQALINIDNKIDNKETAEEEEMTANPERIEYKQGFYYEPLSEELKKRITGISYPATEEKAEISYDDLRYVSVLHYNFKGIERTGELICNKAIAQDFVEIFYELYQNEYQIEQIALIDEYGGDDTLSMQDNNTSCFNYRVVDGTSRLSRHALGLAIDINPFFNPYVVYKEDGTTYISPQGSETYADRSKEFAYKIDENDLCYKLFKEHGFTWGGHWNSSKDYQHFQKVPE